jgi:hypothetical protein
MAGMFDNVVFLLTGFITGPYVLIFSIFCFFLFVILGNTQKRRKTLYYLDSMFSFSKERIFINLGMLFSLIGLFFAFLSNIAIGVFITLFWIIAGFILMKLMEAFGNEDNENF